MAIASITIDDNDFCYSTLPGLERAFGVTLPNDLRHICTAGDLFDAIIALRQPTAQGARCDSAMVFYRLRRAFARHNRGVVIRTGTPLGSLTGESPKWLAARLARETGLQMPPVEVSTLGCIIGLATLLAAPLAWYFAGSRAFALVAVAGAALFWLDRGGFTGAWQTVGSLASAIARENVALLAEMGARNRPEDWWRHYCEILADAAQPVDREARPLMAKRIGRETRFDLC